MLRILKYVHYYYNYNTLHFITLSKGIVTL